MSYLIDSDICSAHLRQKGSVTNRFLQYSGRLHVSIITVGELMTWALRANAPPQRMQAIENLLRELVVCEIDDLVAREFARLRAAMLDAGRPTPEMDLWITATAISHGLTVVTHNVRDFQHIPGLKLEDWLSP